MENFSLRKYSTNNKINYVIKEKDADLNNININPNITIHPPDNKESNIIHIYNSIGNPYPLASICSENNYFELIFEDNIHKNI